jgi:hypothetical protein
MNRLIALCSFSFLATAALAQDARTVSVKPFHAIKTQGCLTLQLRPDEQPGVQISAPDAERDNVVVESSNGRLTINQKIGKTFINSGKCDPSRIKVAVSHQALQAITASMGAVVRADGRLEARDLDLAAHSGGNLRFDVVTKNLRVEAGEGAQVYLTGQTESLQTNIVTGATLDAYGLESQDVFVKSSTGGAARVKALKRIDATAGTGGSITYKGRPERRDETKALGGEIISRN